jgi:transposase InsO family protein
VLGRRLLVDRILIDEMAVAHAADMAGVSRETAWKWLRRFEAEGEAGLEDRSSRPHRMPRALPRARVDAILAARHAHRFGPHRLAPLVGVPRSTIGDVLTRHGLSRLRDQDGPTGIPILAIDDMSRVAYVASFDDERGTTCARFLLDAASFFARHGARIERILTDNAKNYTVSKAFSAALDEIGARHKLTRPSRPQINGKAERFNQTLLRE